MTAEEWRGALRHAAVSFGVTPAAFWVLSVVEWRALVGARDAVLGRGEMEALMRAFPDANHATRGPLRPFGTPPP